MQFTKQVVNEALQKEYDQLKERFFEVAYVEKTIKITTEVKVGFSWEYGLECTPERLPAAYLQQSDADTQLEEKMDQFTKVINKDIEKFWADLEKFAEKSNITAEELLKSFH